MSNQTERAIIFHDSFYNIKVVFPNLKMSNKFTSQNANLDAWDVCVGIDEYIRRSDNQLARALAYQSASNERRELLEMGLGETMPVILDLEAIMARNNVTRF